jgi:membrane protease YdiL (CAAX protease family)
MAGSWGWMKWDLPLRLAPLLAVPFVFAWISRTPISHLGVNLSHPVRDLLLAIPFGLVGFAVAAGFGEYLSRRAGHWFVPDRSDLGLQSLYYVVLNAPIEEWFFRGFFQGELIRWWQAPLLGYLAATLVFGAYHFLGKWGWPPVVGATVAGFGLGLLYLWQPSPPSLLLPVLVHAAITCGFLGMGPYVIFQWRLRRGQIRETAQEPAVTA